MEYAIQQLSALSGISTRTLRYYDEIGLLKPARTNHAGYRFYGAEEVDRLQQILFYRELEFPLAEIMEILSSPGYDSTQALREHGTRLRQKRARLDVLIQTVENTLRMQKGEYLMKDKEKFEGFKEELIQKNEEKYGEELREKFGETEVLEANQKLRGMNRDQYAKAEELEKKVIDLFLRALETGDPAGAAAQEAADCHRQWLSLYWPSYTKESHAGVAQMYVDDPRFTAYYDQHRAGLAQFIRDAVLVYAAG